MKKKSYVFIILLCVVVFFGVLILEDLQIIPYFYTRKSYFNLNSFTFRREKYLFSLKVGNKIEETNFSKELRRIGVNVQDNGMWRFISGTSYILPSFRVLCADGDWTIISDLKRLMLLFEINKTSDGERKAIIEEILPYTNQRGTQLDETFEEIINKHGFDWKTLTIKKDESISQK